MLGQSSWSISTRLYSRRPPSSCSLEGRGERGGEGRGGEGRGGEGRGGEGRGGEGRGGEGRGGEGKGREGKGREGEGEEGGGEGKKGEGKDQYALLRSLYFILEGKVFSPSFKGPVLLGAVTTAYVAA